MKLMLFAFFTFFLFKNTQCLLPPIFQWKTIDFAWESQAREAALKSGAYIPENNMPAGIARWKDKLFIMMEKSQSQPLIPYPSWGEAFVSDAACCISSNSTVVSTFRVHVDKCDRLWVVDNGVADMSREVRQITAPAILVFDLNTDKLIRRYLIKDEVLRDSSVLTSIVVDTSGGCGDAYAYIPDMGSNALLVYSAAHDDAWRVEHPYLHFDPHAAVYRVGGVDFYWSDGVSSAALAPRKSSRFPDLYFHPTSSTKQFRMSTKLLRNKDAPPEDIFSAVELVGDRGQMSQATACDLDMNSNVLFYTQLSRNGVSCWNTEKPLTQENVPLIISDCTVLEFPSDIKVDQEGNLWILSNRQSRFLYESMDFAQVNFRILTAPVTEVIRGTPCEKLSAMERALSFIRPKSSKKSSKTSQ